MDGYERVNMKILFIGDSLFDTEKVIIDEQILRLCRGVDCVIVNLEGPITEKLPGSTKKNPINTTPKALEILKKLNVGLAILANNHSMDFGEKGIENTLENLNSIGVRYAGIGAPTKSIQVGNMKIAVMAFSHREGLMSPEIYGAPFSLPKWEILQNQIEGMICKNDITLFSYHGGEEHFFYPWPRRAAFLRKLARSGITIVLGHHSHSVQPIEIHNNVPVIFSLGNFYLNTIRQKQRVGTDKGVLIEFEFQHGKPINLTQHFTKIDRSERRISLVKTTQLSVSHDVILPNIQHQEKWEDECRNLLNLNIGTLGKIKPIWLRARVRQIKYLVQILLGKARLIDRDILFSTIPWLKNFHFQKMLRNGAKDFQF